MFVCVYVWHCGIARIPGLLDLSGVGFVACRYCWTYGDRKDSTVHSVLHTVIKGIA